MQDDMISECNVQHNARLAQHGISVVLVALTTEWCGILGIQ